MNDRPDALELLRIARRTVLDNMLPKLPDELRYTALMVANAMAIAEREIAGGESAARAELARLRELLADVPEPTGGVALNDVLTDCNRRLVAKIRAGRFDGDSRPALLDHLRQTATDKLAVSNPKALDP